MEPAIQSTTPTATPARLIDQTHDTDSAVFKAIQATKTHGKDYDAYLMEMLTNKIPSRQAELLYKKIGAELGFILSVLQKKEIAKTSFAENDISTQEGIDKVLASLPEQIGLSKGGVKGWMKKYAEAKKITLGKASIATAGPSAKTIEIFDFIFRGHEAGKDRKTIIDAVIAKYELKESTVKMRYAKVARDNDWNTNPEDKVLKDWAVMNARTGTKDDVTKLHPKASKAAIKQVISALAFFQAVMSVEEKATVEQATA